MIRDIVKDTTALSVKCTRASEGDLGVVQDMLDTAESFLGSRGCVGLACNQIGGTKRIIVIRVGDRFIPMINPIIRKHSKGTIVSEEGCLSFEGTQPVERWTWVHVWYYDTNFKLKKATIKDFLGYVVQHEIDHLNGKMI